MKWYIYLAHLGAGIFLTNGVPTSLMEYPATDFKLLLLHRVVWGSHPR